MVRERGLEPLSTDDMKLRVLSFTIREKWHFIKLGKAKNFILINHATILHAYTLLF